MGALHWWNQAWAEIQEAEVEHKEHLVDTPPGGGSTLDPTGGSTPGGAEEEGDDEMQLTQEAGHSPVASEGHHFCQGTGCAGP